MMPVAFRDDDGLLRQVSSEHPLPTAGGGGGSGGDASAANQTLILTAIQDSNARLDAVIDLLTIIATNTTNVVVV